MENKILIWKKKALLKDETNGGERISLWKNFFLNFMVRCSTGRRSCARARVKVIQPLGLPLAADVENDRGRRLKEAAGEQSWSVDRLLWTWYLFIRCWGILLFSLKTTTAVKSNKQCVRVSRFRNTITNNFERCVGWFACRWWLPFISAAIYPTRNDVNRRYKKKERKTN